MLYKEKCKSYRIEEDNLITKFPVTQGAILSEAIRLGILFSSPEDLSKGQFKTVKQRYYNLMLRDLDIAESLSVQYETFLQYQF